MPELDYDRSFRKRRKLCDLSFKEKLDIVFKVSIEFQAVRDVAYLYRVSLAVVRSLVRKSEKNTNFFAELNDQQT